MSVLKLKDHIYPILWRGTAWIYPNTGAVKRIEARLGAPMEDLGLLELQAELEYMPVFLPGAREDFWLPKRAAISLRSQRQVWRNVHEFSGYRLFSVTTSTGVLN